MHLSSTRIEDLCHTQMALSLRRVCGQRPHTDHVTNPLKRLGNRGPHGLWSMPSVWIILGLVTPAAPLKPLEGITLAFTPSWED